MEDINMANLSGKKLSIIGILIVTQFICILIGGLIDLRISSSQYILDTPCKVDPLYTVYTKSEKWYYTRGNGSCAAVYLFSDNDDDYYNINENEFHHIVHTFQLPLPTNGMQLDYSRWQQNLIGILEIDGVKYNPWQISPLSMIILDVRLAYRNKGDPDDAWKPYASSIVGKFLDCSINKYEMANYDCKPIPLFELSNLYHDYYLVNIHLLINAESNIGQELKHITDMSLITINQNGGFTKIWLGLKTFFFPIVLAFLIWYWRRVCTLSRSPAPFEYMLLSLGLVLSFLNMPLEYLTIYFDIPFMMLFNEIRQFIFYIVLLSFWIIFSFEHSVTQKDVQRSNLKYYLKILTSVLIPCLSIFIIGIYERASQLENPFYFYWNSNTDMKFESIFIFLVGWYFAMYSLFMSKTIWKIFMKLKYVILPTMRSSQEQSHYEEVLYRFQFIATATLLCAFLTFVLIFCQLMNNQWKWKEDKRLVIAPELVTGVYGMWNIYTISLLYLYAPLSKKTIQQQSKQTNIYTVYSPS